MNIHVACGSWADDDYVGVLYPKTLPAKLRLQGYAQWFDHVEVNSTYYATPKRSTVESWLALTPPGFTFNIKLHRAFSQGPRKAAENGILIPKLLDALAPLIAQKRLAAFFLVMPPTFSPDRRQLEELDGVAEQLRPHVLAIELRHRDWITGAQREKTLDYFRRQKLVLIGVDMPQVAGSSLMTALDVITDPRCVYFRLHGRNRKYLEAKTAAEGHTYAYKEGELREIAARVLRVAGDAAFVHVVANNHARDFAPKTALALQKLLGVVVKNQPLEASSKKLTLKKTGPKKRQRSKTRVGKTPRASSPKIISRGPKKGQKAKVAKRVLTRSKRPK